MVLDFDFLTFSQELCYDGESAALTSKDAVAAIDKLDFVFVDGDSRLLPWHARTRKVGLGLGTLSDKRGTYIAS